MFISKLKIYNFRSIKEKEFLFTKNINIFYGKNGIGKTSIIEAINFLSSGKSFRKGSSKSLIQFNCLNLTVYIESFKNDIPYTIGVNKHKNGKWKSQFNNNKHIKQSDISRYFPVVSIDPEVYRLVDFGPLYRRNFLDWLVFHVKHEYLILWKKVHRCIKQLNLLYKSNVSINEIKNWEKSFVTYSEKLNTIRKEFFDKIQPIIIKLTKNMQGEIKDLSISFKQGWSNNIKLSEQINIDRSKNIRFGQILHGPHKMDIKISTSNVPASQTLSRGQKKILSITFYMAYIEILKEFNIKPILCLDDFDAEIDKSKLQKAAEFFINSNAQIFITSVDKNKIKKIFPSAELFHVKH